MLQTCGWFLRQDLRSSVRRPRAIPPDMVRFLSLEFSHFLTLKNSFFSLYAFGDFLLKLGGERTKRRLRFYFRLPILPLLWGGERERERRGGGERKAPNKNVRSRSDHWLVRSSSLDKWLVVALSLLCFLDFNLNLEITREKNKVNYLLDLFTFY